MKRLHSILAALICLSLSGCSVYMAATSPSEPNTSLLQPGTERKEVEKILGRPISFSRFPDGDVATYQYFGPDTISYRRAAVYALVDALTVGIAEFFTTPIETLQNDKHTVIVTYDLSGRIREIASKSQQAPLRPPEKILGIES